MQRFPPVKSNTIQTSSLKHVNPEKQNFFFDIVDKTSFKVKVNLAMLKGGCQIVIYDDCTPDSAMGPQVLEWGTLSYTDYKPDPADKRVFKIKGGMVEALRTDPKYSTISDGFEMPFWRIRGAVGNYLTKNRELLRTPINPSFYDLRNDPLGWSSPIKIICECNMSPIFKPHLVITDEWVNIFFN